jgi:antitoxin VapB
MALSIKTDEADRLARELVALTHESLTQAVTTALKERLARVRARQRVDLAQRIEKLVLEYERHPLVDDRSPDEIIGYDEHGLPA